MFVAAPVAKTSTWVVRPLAALVGMGAANENTTSELKMQV
jgi:hypothetical protein